MFGIVLILVATLMHVYVFWRAASVPFVKRHVSRRLLIGLGVVLWCVFYLGRVYGHGGTGTLAAVLKLLGMDWLATLFLISMCLLVVDVITLFGFLVPKPAPSMRGWALTAGAVLSAIALMQGLRPPIVQEYEVRLAGLPPELDGTVLVALSDTHLGSLIGEDWLVARVAQMQEQRPDMVVLLGDIFEGHGPPSEELVSTLGCISAPLGRWAVPGNHESHGPSDTALAAITEAGFDVLVDRWVEVRPGLIVAGLEDLTSVRRRGLGGDPASTALAGRPPAATIVLSHTPWEAERIAKAGAGLMLSGHTHGGQIWPFSYFVRLSYPLLGGRYDVDGMTVIVCRGSGTWGPRMRLWRRGEILRITLRSQQAQDAVK